MSKIILNRKSGDPSPLAGNPARKFRRILDRHLTISTEIEELQINRLGMYDQDLGVVCDELERAASEGRLTRIRKFVFHNDNSDDRSRNLTFRFNSLERIFQLLGRLGGTESITLIDARVGRAEVWDALIDLVDNRMEDILELNINRCLLEKFPGHFKRLIETLENKRENGFGIGGLSFVPISKTLRGRAQRLVIGRQEIDELRDARRRLEEVENYRPRL